MADRAWMAKNTTSASSQARKWGRQIVIYHDPCEVRKDCRKHNYKKKTLFQLSRYATINMFFKFFQTTQRQTK
ncbi:MAG: hypothetical protein WC789_10235 [Lentisphaeria bacterium]|jgi:hypothetical protein